MEILGRLVTAHNPARLPVALVSAGAKQMAFAVVVATFPDAGGDRAVQDCIDLVALTANANGLFGDLHKVEVATLDGADRRIEMTLASATDGDVLVYLCADPAIFDRVWRCLNVRAG